MKELKKLKTLLQEAVIEHTTEPGSYATAIPGVGLHRRDAPTKPESHFYVPRIIKIVQGCKRSLIGGNEYFYDADNLFIAGVDIPNTSNITVASSEKPCMSITIDMDKNLIAQLAMEMPDIAPSDDDEGSGLLIQPAESETLDALLRLLALLDKPEQVPILAPLILKEIYYRVLTGPGGDRLRLFYTFGSQKNQVAKAIAWLRENFVERFTIKELADKVHMASPTFHRRFKETTTISPLQFQKRLRLHEAQRLMLADEFDASSACQAVGYESLTQFNREYKRLFGDPPLRNVNRWRREQKLMPAIMPGE